MVHVEPTQQPAGQDAELHVHVPAMHICPGAHGGSRPQRQTPPAQESAPTPQSTHAAPLAPHAAGVGGAVQVDPAQQPAGHDAASQTQAPPTQRAPAPQAGPWPH